MPDVLRPYHNPSSSVLTRFREVVERRRSAQAHGDGSKSVRHDAHAKKLENVLSIIRGKGYNKGFEAAQKAGLAAHPQVRQALSTAR